MIVIGQVLEGCHNARNIADDILVHGATREEHDRSLENMLFRLQDKNLTVNPAKCLFGVTELDYYGFHISAQGISPDRNRIQAMKQMQPPSTPTEARSFLGLVFRSKPRCCDRAYTKNHTQEPSMVVGSEAI